MAIDGRNVSGSMQTPTTTMRDCNGAAVMTCSMMPGTPTHSKTTGPRGRAPSFSAAWKTRGHGRKGTARSFFMVLMPRSMKSGADVR